MALIIPEPEIWPVFEARIDLEDSLRVLDYARYGLEIRELLEVVGPYTLNARDRNDLWRLRIDNLDASLDRSEATRRYGAQKEALLRNARGQFLVYAYSAFDFLVANLLIFVYVKSGNSPGIPPRPADSDFIWDEAVRQRFLADARIADIEEPKWMVAQGKSSVVDDRVKLLESVCGIPIRRYRFKSQGGRTLDWPLVSSLRRIRHNIAHTSGRSAVHTDPSREHKLITETDISDLESYMRQLLAAINHSVYDVPMLARRS